MLYHIERFTIDGWVRIAADLTSYDVARNIQKAVAKAAGLDIDNYSILVEVTD